MRNEGGNPNAEFSSAVSVIEIYPSSPLSPSSSQLTTRVALGFQDGTVACTTAPKVMSHDKNARSAKFSRCRIQDAHQGSITSIAFGGEGILGNKSTYDALTFATACTRGIVKLWESKRMACLWTGFVSQVSGANSLNPQDLRVLRVAYDAPGGHVVAALRCGDVIVCSGRDVWIDAGVSRLSTASSFTPSMPLVSLDDPRIQFRFPLCCRIPRPTDDSIASTPSTDPIPSCLFIQPSEPRVRLSGESAALQVGLCYAGESGFYRFSVGFRSTA